MNHAADYYDPDREELYLGDQHSRSKAAERRVHVEIEVMRDVEDAHGNVLGRRRIKRRGVIHRANGMTLFVGPYCYHIDEILHYREVAHAAPAS